MMIGSQLSRGVKRAGNHRLVGGGTGDITVQPAGAYVSDGTESTSLRLKKVGLDRGAASKVAAHSVPPFRALDWG